MRGKFKFLYVDIWFDVTECKFITKNSSFKTLVVFSPIFVADTKITFVYNFVAPLNYGYLSFNIDCYYLKGNTIVNNLTACLIFIKYHIYNFSNFTGKIFFKVLFFCSNLYQCFLINNHFSLVCKLVSILSFI